MTHWIPALVFINGIAMTIPMVISYRSDHTERVKSLAITNAVIYSERMRDEIQKGVTLTESLKLIIQSAHGGAAVIDDGSEESHVDAAIDNFESIAKSLMTDYIGSIQLAPNGIVTTTYPEVGDAGKNRPFEFYGRPRQIFKLREGPQRRYDTRSVHYESGRKRHRDTQSRVHNPRSQSRFRRSFLGFYHRDNQSSGNFRQFDKSARIFRL